MARPDAIARASAACALAALALACKSAPSAPAAPAGSATSSTAVATAAIPSTAPAAADASGGTTATHPITRGDKAPAFSLAGSDGKTHALADHAGKDVVVVAWFPKAFTGG
jgi:hypothetical protein